MSYFTPDLFKFLKDLKAHNTRPWFESNKPRYEEDVKEPMLRFITDLGPRLKKISPYLTADSRPAGGSMFRIYRDVRFSKDKSPYKTNVGAHFSHVREKDVHAPGLYCICHRGSPLAGAACGILKRTPSGRCATVSSRAWRSGRASNAQA